MAWGDPRWYFLETQPNLGALASAEPDDSYFSLTTSEHLPGVPLIRGRNVDWIVGSNYVVWVPADHILFMEGNSWNFGHAAAIFRAIEAGQRPALELPAGRLYRIDDDLVRSTQALYDRDELEYQRGMEKPWTAKDAGTFWVQLLDGNHRALAAIAAGEEAVPVVVGENYRQDVHPHEWVAPDAVGPKPRKARKPAPRRRR
jgi:hypothetical protein